jgi:hypothetical protein
VRVPERLTRGVPARHATRHATRHAATRARLEARATLGQAEELRRVLEELGERIAE